MPTNHTHHTSPSRPLERTLIAFCLLAALSGVVVYLAIPTVYTDLLMLHLSPMDRYPIRATLVLVGILLVIATVMVGVLQHWRWLFWLLLIAFGASIPRDAQRDASKRTMDGKVTSLAIPTTSFAYRSCGRSSASKCHLCMHPSKVQSHFV